MIASLNSSWMIASIVVAVVLTLAAMTLERVVSLHRGRPLRWIWAAAMALSVAVSGLWLRTPGASRFAVAAAPPSAPPVSRAERRVSAVAPAAPSRQATNSVSVARALVGAALRVPRLPDLIEFAIRRAWLATSLAMLLLLLFSAVRLWRDRRAWRAASVLDAAVLVSEDFGPAIVGVVHPAIVVPQWVLGLDAAAQRTIVVHEEEHRTAGDPRLLLAALAALVVMPWNLGLWLMWRRLNRAVELDCDQRVLARGVRDGDYANVLLGAWQRARGSAVWLPSPAFAERASGLGKRVQHLMRPEPRRRVMKTLTGSVMAVALVAVAMLVPAPQGAISAQGVQEVQMGPMPLIVINGLKRKDLADVKSLQAAVRELTDVKHDSIGVSQHVDSANAVRLYGTDGIHGATAIWTKSYIASGGAVLPRGVVAGEAVRRADPSTTVEQFAAAMYANLFKDIKLSAENEAKARAIILDYQKAQHALSGPYLVIWPKRLALDTVRDNRLHALLTNAADRARYDAKVEQGPAQRVSTVQEVAKNTSFNYVYQVPVTEDENAKILAILVRSLLEEKALFERAPADSAARDALLAKRTADVRTAISNPATREAFDKRQAQIEKMRARP